MNPAQRALADQERRQQSQRRKRSVQDPHGRKAAGKRGLDYRSLGGRQRVHYLDVGAGVAATDLLGSLWAEGGD